MDTILAPIEWAVAWIMYGCHSLLVWLGMSDGAGPAWVLSIIGLVIIVRILIMPLFFRQIKAQRGMQMLQPELQALQKRYKNRNDPASREAMSREMMELYRKHGTSPFASCMPMLLQAPIFFSLYRVLIALKPIGEGSRDSIGPITQAVATAAESSTVFGAPLSSSFLGADSTTGVKIVSMILIIAMATTQFITQRQITMKNMPPAALEGPMAQTQKMMVYGMPIIFGVSGVAFPVGVLVYWVTTNLWTAAQQLYTISRMPTPGSEAEKKLNERRAKKAARKGIVATNEAGPTVITAPVVQPKGQRQQPKRTPRSKRKK